MKTPDASSPETLLAVAVVLAAFAAAFAKVQGFGGWERLVNRVASRRRLSVLCAAMLPLVLRLFLIPVFPPPEPRLHDEFSFLLGASTIVEGRLSNPQHPFWPHFESMHILSKPTYSSAFPPGQAAVLAAGMLLGEPWIGVWLSVGIMCGTLCWMLRGWLPPRWALLGALIVGLRIGVSSYWMNSYWGGALAATAGALVLGAVPRLLDRPRWTQSIVMGLGLTILAVTRAYEGAVLGIVVALVLLKWLTGRGRPPAATAFRHVVIPLSLVLVPALSALLYYFGRVTGNPSKPPYVLYRTTMTTAPHFVWQTPRPEPLYNNREMRHFYTAVETASYRHARSEPVATLVEKAGHYWRFYFGPLLTIPLIGVPFLMRRPRFRQAVFMLTGFSAALAVEVWHNAHYAAPAAGLMLLIVMASMRYLRLWRCGDRPVGLYLVRSIPFACVAMLLIQICSPAPRDRNTATWRWPEPKGLERARILDGLERSSGQHLVFVRYGPLHDAGDEWVYNGADIDGSKVVWARELDWSSNRKLIGYFPSRTVWLVEPDLAEPKLVSYTDALRRPMGFVPLGAPGIDTLRSPDEVARKIREIAGADRLGCDAWNFYFTQATGVMGPDIEKGCYEGDRAQLVAFDRYRDWLERQR